MGVVLGEKPWGESGEQTRLRDASCHYSLQRDIHGELMIVAPLEVSSEQLALTYMGTTLRRR